MKLTDLLAEHGVQFRTEGHPHVTSGFIGTDCPWCGRGSGRFHLGINLRGGYCTCWRCGYKRLVDVLAEVTGLPVSECYRLVKEIGGTAAIKPSTHVKRELRLPDGLDVLWEPHRNYLIRRGFDPDEIVRLWGVRAIGVRCRLGWRLWIPIHLRGEVVSWTTRAIGKALPRYVSAARDEEAVPAKSLLYGEDHVRGGVVICEGPLDAWAVGPGAVATLGTGWTRRQLLRMARHPVRAVCFDAEPEAQARARGLAEELKQFPGETHLVELETGKDAAEADGVEIEDVRRRFLG